jgi:hypothetical protein
MCICVSIATKRVAETNIWLNAFSECLTYYPCVIVGLICGKYRIYEKVNKKIDIGITISVLGILVALALKRIAIHFVGVYADGVIVAVLVFNLNKFLNYLTKFKITDNFVALLGKNSTSMWFFHANFFSIYSRWFFQPIVAWTRNWIAIYILILLISLLISKCFEKVIKIITMKKGRLQ